MKKCRCIVVRMVKRLCFVSDKKLYFFCLKILYNLPLILWAEIPIVERRSKEMSLWGLNVFVGVKCLCGG